MLSNVYADIDIHRLLVESVKDYGIFVLDPGGHIASWNEGAERIKGYTAEDILGHHFSIFYTAEDLATNKPAYELEVARRVGRFEDEGWRVRKDGRHFWANVIITALWDADGVFVGFAKVTRDLTERREAHERAIQSERTLAAEAAARAAAEIRSEELAELTEQLAKRTKEAEEANQAKAIFLASMSHELRTPLNAIGGYAELLSLGLRGPVTDEQRDDLHRIRRSQQHLLGIINDILNFSRIEAGYLTYDFDFMRVEDIMKSIKAMIAPQAQMKGLHYEQSHCPADIRVYADRAKTEQVLLNMLSNAVKFTQPSGHVTLECDFTPEHIHFHVTDTGCGIGADVCESIFEPFVQVGRSLTQVSEGTGLGLAISRDLARGMHGDLTVESTVGQGSRFTLTLPRTQPAPCTTLAL